MGGYRTYQAKQSGQPIQFWIEEVDLLVHSHYEGATDSVIHTRNYRSPRCLCSFRCYWAAGPNVSGCCAGAYVPAGEEFV
ncbi:unnamed protein product [Strongylus vulgaris]|uniref:Uncharacterized protein n=1 Tax=Strongylus vulgaris TaxID=40348 RepID=A0A3P7IUB9_STRVU|nr:unnamed protein product [Strongylus vulgaris]